jgi:hypothetical protein
MKMNIRSLPHPNNYGRARLMFDGELCIGILDEKVYADLLIQAAIGQSEIIKIQNELLHARDFLKEKKLDAQFKTYMDLQNSREKYEEKQ